MRVNKKMKIKTFVVLCELRGLSKYSRGHRNDLKYFKIRRIISVYAKHYKAKTIKNQDIPYFSLGKPELYDGMHLAPKS